MEASGLCHTDIHAANGDWPVTPTVPFIPGHEGVGIVTAVGDGVTNPPVGQRVAVPWLGYRLPSREGAPTMPGIGVPCTTSELASARGSFS
jgi:threonine dehydrogenase-like Zn-dependent dehydrogenase